MMTSRQEKAYQRYLELRHEDVKSPYRVLEKEQNVSYQTIKNWSEKYDWVNRADASIKRVSTGVEKLIEEEKIGGIQLALKYLDAVIEKGLTELNSNNIKIKHDDVVKAIESELKILISQTNINAENNSGKSDNISDQSKDTFAELSEQIAKFNISGGGKNGNTN